MKKIILTFVLAFFFCFNKAVLAEQLDLASFMAAHFNYQGYTDNDSYLEVTAHEYSFTSKKYLHTVPQATCPSIYNGDCKKDPNGNPQVNWHFYYLGKKDPDQNIIYQSKIIWKGNNLEVSGVS